MYSLTNDPLFNFRVSHTGEIWWHPTAKISTRCRLDLTYYPFDYQRCAIAMESVIYNSNELKLQIRDGKNATEAISLSMYSENELWKLVDRNGYALIYRTSNNTAFSRTHYWLCLKRQPDWAETIFLLPIGLLSVVQLMTYILPFHFIDRTSQATVVLLAVAVYEGSITANMPETSQQSRVLNYLHMVFGMSIFTVGVCALTIALVEPDRDFPAPWGLPRLIKRKKEAYRPNENTRKQLPSKTAVAAAVINWMGFLCCLFLVIVYPCVNFLYIMNRQPPSVPIPESETISQSYYPEIDLEA